MYCDTLYCNDNYSYQPDISKYLFKGVVCFQNIKIDTCNHYSLPRVSQYVSMNKDFLEVAVKLNVFRGFKTTNMGNSKIS